MCTNTVNGLSLPVDFCVQQTTSLEAQVRYILVVAALDRIARQNRVAVVAVIVEHILTIRRRPYRVGKKLMLGLCGPGYVFLGMLLVQPLYLLQKYQIRIQVTQTVSQIMHRETAIELREPFVDIVSNQ